MEPKKLYRNTQSKVLGGVCSGLAEYLSIDIAIVRLIFFLLAWFALGGVVVYLAMWIIVPAKPVYQPLPSSDAQLEE